MFDIFYSIGSALLVSIKAQLLQKMLQMTTGGAQNLRNQNPEYLRTGLLKAACTLIRGSLY